MANSLDFSQAASDLSKWIVKNPDIKTEIFRDNWDFSDYVFFTTGVVDQWTLGAVFMNSIVQPGDKEISGVLFQPTNNAVQPKPRIGTVKPCKVDLKFTSKDINQMWKSYLGEIRGKTPAQILEMPIEGFVFTLILRKIKEDVRKKALYKGILNASGTAPQDIFNGFNKLIADNITSGEIPAGNVLAGAAITSSNAVAQVNAVAALVPEDYWDEEMVIICSPRVKKAYDDNYLALNKNLPIASDSVKKGQHDLDRTAFVFRPEIGLIGSDRIIITPRFNLELGMQGEGDLSNLEVEKAERILKIMADFKLGVEINIAKYIWCNDQA